MSRIEEIEETLAEIQAACEPTSWGSPVPVLNASDLRYLLEIAEAAEDVMADFDYVNEWGYEAGGKSLDDNLDRLRQALQDEPQGGDDD